MSKRTFGILVLVCMAMASGGHAQELSDVSKVAITAAPFLEIGVGAKANAMGGAFVATANDASALYWNPSGIARLARPEGVFVHVDWLADINFDYVGFALPAGRFGSVGASITSLSMDDMLVRTEDQPLGTGEYFRSGSIALALSYAINLTDRFSIGFTGKYIREQIWKEAATGVAIDIGTLFTTKFNGMRIGASLSNFGTEMRMTGEDLIEYHDIDLSQMGNNDEIFAELQTDSWPLPLYFQVGLAMEIVQNDLHRLTLALDAIQPTDNTESLNAGMEYGIKEWLFLRAGYRSFIFNWKSLPDFFSLRAGVGNLFPRNTEEGLTFGAGVNLKDVFRIPIRLDYAYVDFGTLDYIQCFSLAIEL